MHLHSNTMGNKKMLHHEKSVRYRIELAQMERTYKDHQVQMPGHFSANQKLRHIIN